MGKYDNLLKEAGEENTPDIGKSKYSALLAEAGDDEVAIKGTEEQPEAESEKKGGYLQGLGEYWSKDIPEAVKGFSARTDARMKRENEPTVLGDMALKATGAKGTVGKYVEGLAGAPERMGRALGTYGGTLGDVTGTGLGLAGKAINKWTGGIAGKAVKPIAEGIGNAISGNKTVQNVAKWYEELSPEEKANYGSSVDMTELLAGYGAGKTATKTAGLIGDVTEGTGKKTLRSGMKIKDTTAKLAGRNVDQGVEQIVNDISKFNLTSKTGGYKGVANKAQSAIDGRKTFVNKALDNFANKDPNALVDVDNILSDLANEIKTGKVEQIFTNEEGVSTFVGEIKKSLDLRNLSGVQHVSNIPKINKTMKDGLDLFSKGKFKIDDAPVKEVVGDLVYLKMLDNVEKYMPDVRNANREIHNLINVKNAALEASKRTGNNKIIGLTDVLGLLGGGPALQSLGVAPGMSTIGPLVAGGIIAKKALSNGRGASALIDVGKGIKSASDATSTLMPTLGVGSASLLRSKEKNKKEKE